MPVGSPVPRVYQGHERRRSPRCAPKSNLTCELIIGDTVHLRAVCIQNISRDGAQVVIDFPIVRMTEVRFAAVVVQEQAEFAAGWVVYSYEDSSGMQITGIGFRHGLNRDKLATIVTA